MKQLGNLTPAIVMLKSILVLSSARIVDPPAGFRSPSPRARPCHRQYRWLVPYTAASRHHALWFLRLPSDTIDQSTIAHVPDIIRRRRRTLTVGHQQDRVTIPLRQGPKQVDDVRPLLRIQIACRFIRQNQPWSMHDRTRNRHALLLPSRQLTGSMGATPLHTHHPQHLVDPSRNPVPLLALQEDRQRNIFRDGQTRDQMERLKDDPD